MARSIEEIKRAMTDVFINNPIVRTVYNIVTPNTTFEREFSTVSIESELFYNVAYGMHTLERVFDTHRAEINEIVANNVAHTPRWYRNKALSFMADMPLVEDTDRYDTGNMTDEQIETARIIKYAVAVENPENSILVIKIATGSPGELTPIEPEQLVQFRNYINEIRDAGVRFSVINQQGDEFWIEIDVYYSPLFLEVDVRWKMQSETT